MANEWLKKAECRSEDIDPEWFFSYDADEKRKALAACAVCSVREECLDSAVNNARNPEGIQGGHLPDDIQKMRRRLGIRSSTVLD
jgi:hypothetical protein